VAREYICEQAHLIGAKYVFFIDDDTIPPPTACRMLTYQLDQDPDVAAIGAIYVSRVEPPTPMVFKGFGEGVYWDWAVGDVFEVDAIGTGCCMIRVSALEDLPKPWFKTVDVVVQGNLKDRGIEGIGAIQNTDDIYFCKKLRAAGKKVLAHGGILCDHWDTDSGTVHRLALDSRPYKLKAEKVDVKS
jgi:cellulose synthase/poly-beta-1,6-N-acetylglucosamine synthase-like glycosyltransferase